MKQFDMLTFGEAMGMFMANTKGNLSKVKEFTKELAGAETNVSIGMARLGFNVAWLSKVGIDPIGTYIIEELQKEKVNISLIKRDSEKLTGFQLKEKVEAGDPFVQYYRSFSAANQMSCEDFPELAQITARHYHMTGIPLALSNPVRELAEHILKKAKTEGKTISFDPNLRPSLWKNEKEMISVIQSFACRADWLFPGISEGALLTGFQEPKDIAAYYLDKGVGLVVIKLGKEGAYVATQQENGIVPGIKVERVADTVGAGDGFAVGVISGLFDGLSYFEAVQRANAIGALAVMSAGDKEGLPTRTELEQFMKRGAVV
ncbi:sugar kinase [Heyndrickxia acidicola]|uniref:Sugar kinase n=1 Tax=Heyndrickxia acidicola TaxID=209389 RepID=A0ABU6MB67_9BACI|nr:sugar kinase [Heyndrickxia acidicola]MED1201524.1 sugar kinase [Heyndrickxia acidicola]